MDNTLSINKEFLIEKSKMIGIDLDDNMVDKFSDYADYLVEINQVMNLTTITEDNDICLLHFIDSILMLKQVSILDKKNISLIDVGTGAGFPAIPCKILRNDIKITLLDSLNKKINFLSNLCNKLSLEANCIHSRAEDLGNDEKHREKYDIATARAVAKLKDLAEYCLPFVKVGGYFIALKSINVTDEIEDAKNAISILGGEIEEVINYNLPDGTPRVIVLIKKISQMSPKFPRTSAKMKKSPL